MGYLTSDTVAIILGGGQGARLFPLTATRSKPAVPIGGKYRLIDVPVSGCLHADIRRIFVLTQFNSASLNRHISNTYRLDRFSGGFVEILAAEQTPDNPNWYQGTADAVRQAARRFRDLEAKYFLILAGDHVYRMDFAELIGTHIARKSDITIAAQPVTPEDATGMGIFRFDEAGQVAGFEEKPKPERLAEMGSSGPMGSPAGLVSPDKPFMASMGIYVFSRHVLFDVLSSSRAVDFGREVIPQALSTHRVHPFLHQGYWADVGTVQSFYDVNLMLTERSAPFNFFHPRRPMYTHARFLPAARVHDSRIDQALIGDGAYLDTCHVQSSVVGIRMSVRRGSQITRSILLGADFYEDATTDLPLGVGRDAVLDRTIVDKNARIGDGAKLVNERGIENADGDGYFIRGGIIIVPKGGVVKPGTVV